MTQRFRFDLSDALTGWMAANGIDAFPCLRCGNCGLYRDVGLRCRAEADCVAAGGYTVTEEDIRQELLAAECERDEAAYDRMIDQKIDEMRGK